MRVGKGLVLVLALACLKSVSAQSGYPGYPDTMWAVKDNVPDTEQYYFRYYLCDTPAVNIGCANDTGSPTPLSITDTGDKWDQNYINFNYQFTTAKPGYAGFKVFWDNGIAKFPCESGGYDSMILVHKGPLPGHKVHMVWGEGGACGGPINYEYMGEFTSSTVWKKESFAFPQKRGNAPQNPYPDSAFVRNDIYELRMLVYDDSSVTTSPTSAPGDLKLDNIGFVRKNTAVRKQVYAQNTFGDSRSFVPAASGKVTLVIFSLQGEQLYKGLVDVSKGQRYNVAQFARRNSPLSTGLVRCIQINGSGISFTGMMHL
jgi:hypothetical protein